MRRSIGFMGRVVEVGWGWVEEGRERGRVDTIFLLV